MNSEQDYLSKLPTKRMGAGALFFNEKHELLIVKPAYRDYWELVGGVVEYNESPKQACIRESKEELGLDLPIGELLCLDYYHQADNTPESLMFVFNGRVIEESELRLNTEELAEYRFATIDEAIKLLHKNIGPRVLAGVKAIESGQIAYLEGGLKV